MGTENSKSRDVLCGDVSTEMFRSNKCLTSRESKSNATRIIAKICIRALGFATNQLFVTDKLGILWRTGPWQLNRNHFSQPSLLHRTNSTQFQNVHNRNNVMNINM